jgi:hypothetical protein
MQFLALMIIDMSNLQDKVGQMNSSLPPDFCTDQKCEIEHVTLNVVSPDYFHQPLAVVTPSPSP